MARRFRYALEPARRAALARERTAAHAHALARARLADSLAQLAALERESPRVQADCAALFAVRYGALALACTRGRAASTEARAGSVRTLDALRAARARRERFDADAARRRAAFDRESEAEERRAFVYETREA